MIAASGTDAAKPIIKAGSGTCTHCVECFTLAWTAGLLTAFLQGEQYLIAVLPVGLLFVVLLRRRLARYRAGICCVLAGLLLGTAVWQLYDLTVRLPICALNGQTVRCTGEITDTEDYAGDRTRYTLRTVLAGHRVSIDWYAGSDAGGLQIGDLVTLDAELTRIKSDYRYHTAEYQAGLGRYLRIYDAELCDVQADSGFSLRRTLHTYRAYITELIAQRMTPDAAGLMCSMLFGDSVLLSEETDTALNRTGIGHVTAVSGLHLVFFCMLLMWIWKRLRLSARLSLYLNLAAILLFIGLVDASVGVYRAALMVLLAQSAVLFGRYGDTLRSLCVAMFLCTVFTPYVIGSAAFWLSVSGVLGIGVIAPYMTRDLACGRLTKHFLALCCVAVTVFPAMVLLCGESSLLSPICNLVILPFCIAALYLGLLLICTGGLTAFLLPAAELICRFVTVTVRFTARLPFSHLAVASQAVRLTVLLCTITLLLFAAMRAAPKHLVSALLAAAAVLAGQLAFQRIQAAGQLQIAVLGQPAQAALVISAEGRTVIADLSGAVQNAQYVQTYLETHGIARVDALILNGSGTAAAYQAELQTVTVGAVRMQDSLPWRDGLTVCGVTPVFCGDLTLTSGSAEIICGGGSAEIVWRGMTVSVLPADSTEPAAASVVIRYGGIPAASDSYAIRILPAAAPAQCTEGEYAGNNQLLRITKDGRADVQPLE